MRSGSVEEGNERNMEEDEGALREEGESFVHYYACALVTAPYVGDLSSTVSL